MKYPLSRWLLTTVIGLSCLTVSAWATAGNLVQVERIVSGQQLHLRFKTNQAVQPRLQSHQQQVVLELPQMALAAGNLAPLLSLRTQVPPFLPKLNEVLLSQSHPSHPQQHMIYLKLVFEKPVQAKVASQGGTAFDLILAPVGGSMATTPYTPPKAPASPSPSLPPLSPTALQWKVYRIESKPGIEPLAEYRPVFGNEWRPLLTGQSIVDNKQMRTGPGEQVTLRQHKLQVQLQEETIINLAGTENNRLLLNQGLLAVEGEAQSNKGYRFFGPGYYLVSSDAGPVAFLMARDFVVALTGQVTIYQNNVLKVIPPGQYLDTQNLNAVPVTESLLQRLVPPHNPGLEGWMRRYMGTW